MSYIVSIDEMKQAEIMAVQRGGSFLQLMERAGQGAAEALSMTLSLPGLACVILAGRGNNGGDGFVLARRLRELGAEVTVVLAQGFPGAGDARVNFGRLQDTGVRLLTLDDGEAQERIRAAALLVDAIFGTGFHGALPEELLPLCSWYRGNRGALHVALDIPSGVNAQSGVVENVCFPADLTLTFAAYKPGQFLFPGGGFCGRVQVVDIGITESMLSLTGCTLRMITPQFVSRSLPPRPRNSHKGTFGHVLIVAGSLPYTGAAVLACTSALRSGAGLVTLAGVPHVTDTVNLRLPEAITLPLPQNEQGGIAAEEALPLLKERLASCSALVMGPGMGATPDTLALVEGLLEAARCPVVLDADALNVLGPHLILLEQAKAPVILTPHPGEMARLSGKLTAEVERDRLGAARDFARIHKVILVLKGTYTVIAGPDGQMLLNQAGSSGLAKGGSGDLLAGLIGGLAAGKIPSFAAAACGVYLHAKAAELCAEECSEYAMTATDVAAFLGNAFLSL